MEQLLEILSFNFDNINIAGLILLLTAFLIGIKFPDWDFKMKLRHRNILTHSPLILGVFYLAYKRNSSAEFRYFIMGFSLAIGIHLIFDIFPKAWKGGANLQTPFIKYCFSKRKSQILLFISIIICLLVTTFSTINIEEYLLSTLFGVLVIVLNVRKEEKLVRPLVLYLIIIIIAGSFRHPMVERLLVDIYTMIKTLLTNYIN